MSQVQRLFVLLCGYEVLPKAISTLGGGDRFVLAEPVCAYLLDTQRGWVLLDTGIDPAYANDPVLRDRHFLAHGWAPPVVKPGHELDRQLAQIGIGIEDIDHVILSHLHFDHCDRLSRFAHARISVQHREFEAGFSAAPALGYLPRDYDDPALDWDLREGDWEAMPGLELLDTRGHTAGHQSALVTLASGKTVLLPFDAGDLAENFEREVGPGTATDAEAAMASIRRLKNLQGRHGAEMLLFHDPVAIQAMRLAPEFYS